MFRYVYSIDYPLGQKRSYLEWVRSVAEVLQAPPEVKRLASFDNVFGASPQRSVEFEFDTLQDAAKYFERPEISRIFQAELPARASNVRVSVMKSLGEYDKR